VTVVRWACCTTRVARWAHDSFNPYAALYQIPLRSSIADWGGNVAVAVVQTSGFCSCHIVYSQSRHIRLAATRNAALLAPRLTIVYGDSGDARLHADAKRFTDPSNSRQISRHACEHHPHSDLQASGFPVVCRKLLSIIVASTAPEVPCRV
jgi:hypothetical protein